MEDDIRPFISDYGMELIQVCRPDKIYQFRTEVKQFFQLMSGLKNVESLYQYWKEHPKEYIDTDTLYAATIASGSHESVV